MLRAALALVGLVLLGLGCQARAVVPSDATIPQQQDTGRTLIPIPGRTCPPCPVCQPPTPVPVPAPPPTPRRCADPAGFIADRSAVPLPQLPVLPPAGGKLRDPGFGSQILRITGPGDGSWCQTSYSYWPTLNSDSTRLHVQCSGGPRLFVLDPATLGLSAGRPLFSRPPPSGGLPVWEDSIWSALDPHILFAHEGTRLWALDVDTGAWTLIKDLGQLLPGISHLKQMSRSQDDRVWAFTTQDAAFRALGYAVWDRGRDALLLEQRPTSLDEVQVDRSGRWLTVQTGVSGSASAIEARVFDLVNRTVTDLTDGAPDYAPAHADTGSGIWVGHDNWRNALTWRSLAAPHTHRIVLDLGGDWGIGYHVGMGARTDDFALVSTYGSEPPGAFRGELLLVALDGSQRVKHLAHHRSVVRTYEDMPRANISSDGCLVAWTSNWGTARRDVFLLRVGE